MALPTGDWGSGLGEGLFVGMQFANMRRQAAHDAWAQGMAQDTLALHRAALDRQRITEEHQQRMDALAAQKSNFGELTADAPGLRGLQTKFPQAGAQPYVSAYDDAARAMATGGPDATVSRDQPGFIGQMTTPDQPMGPFPISGPESQMPASAVRRAALTRGMNLFGDAQAAENTRQETLAKAQLTQRGRTSDAAERTAANREDRHNREFETFVQKATPQLASSRAGMGVANNVFARGARIMALLGNNASKEALDKLSPQWADEAATAVAAMITNGNAPALETIRRFLPAGIDKDVAWWKGYFRNAPQAAGQGAFLQQIASTIDREDKQARIQMLRGQLGAIPGYSHLAGFPETGQRWKDWVETQGFGPALTATNGVRPEIMAQLMGGTLPHELESPPLVSSKAEFDALPEGARFFNMQTRSLDTKLPPGPPGAR